MVVTPSDAALLAKRIYDVQNPALVNLFLSLPPFEGAGKNPRGTHLKAEVGGRVVLNHKDGFGVCSEGGGRYKGEVFIVFRGTTKGNGRADLLTDARIGLTLGEVGAPVHSGFLHCFSSMLPEIKKYFASLSGRPGGVKAVHCIGHSLGGAVASLAADWVARTLKYPTRLYTFGAPRVGTGMFVKRTTAALGASNIYRVHHKTDPVPIVPLYPFMHAPYGEGGCFIHSSEPLISGVAHKMARYSESVKGKSWQSLSGAREEPYTLESAIESWLESKSPVNSESPSFWRWVDSALIYVMKKITASALSLLQAPFVGMLTVADRIAYLLALGIKMGERIGYWVERLMRKMMGALGLKTPDDKGDLTQGLMRHVLRRLTEKSNREARKAVEKL